MRKQTFCICENKDADQLRSNCTPDQRLSFTIQIVQYLFYLNPKFQASSHFLCLYRPVCVNLVDNPNCWFMRRLKYDLADVQADLGILMTVKVIPDMSCQGMCSIS